MDRADSPVVLTDLTHHSSSGAVPPLQPGWGSHEPLHMGDAADSLLVNVKFTCCLEISVVPGNSSPPWKIRRNCRAGGPVAQNALFSVVMSCDYTVRTTERGLACAINILPQPAATLS